jgi:hypothetical protein
MGLCANAVQVENRSKLFAFIVLNCLTYSVVRILTLPQKAPGTPGAREIKFQSLTEHIDTETCGRCSVFGVVATSNRKPPLRFVLSRAGGMLHAS